MTLWSYHPHGKDPVISLTVRIQYENCQPKLTDMNIRLLSAPKTPIPCLLLLDPERHDLGELGV